MRRLLLLAALCAAVVLALTPAAGATSYAYGSCAEIPTQEMAQGTLDDPNYSTLGADEDELNLDPDGDGVACNNPGNTVGGEGLGGPGADLSCVDFAPTGGSPEEAQAQAQAVLDEDPSDPSGLDADGDGLACEFEASSTGEVSFEDGSGMVVDYAAPAPQQYEQTSDLDCADFGSREEAQAALDAEPSDSSNLDADGDGLACEELISAPPTQAAPPTQTDVPDDSQSCEEAVAQTGSRINCEPLQAVPAASEEASETPEELPATGGPALTQPLLMGALLLTGLGGVLALAARRAT